MEKCKRMKRQRCMSKNWICSWQWKSSRTRQQYYRSESFAIKTDIPTNGSMVKNHISLKTGFGLSVTRRTSFLLWFQACQVRPQDLHQLQGHLWNRRVILHHLLHPHLLHLQQAKFRFEKGKMHLSVTSLQCQCLSWLMIDQGDLMKPKPTKSRKPIKRKPR